MKDRLKELRTAARLLTSDNELELDPEPAREIQIEGTLSSSLRDLFLQVDQVQDSINKLEVIITGLRYLYIDRIMNPLPNPEQRGTLESMRVEIKTHFSSVHAKLYNMAREIEEEQRGSHRHSTELRIRKAQHAHLSRKFMSVMEDYNQVQVEYRENRKQQMVRKYKIIGLNRAPEELEQMLDEYDVSVCAQDAQECSVTEERKSREAEDVEAQHNDIIKTEKTFQDFCFELAKMVLLVDEQEDLTDNIKFNVRSAHEYDKESMSDGGPSRPAENCPSSSQSDSDSDSDLGLDVCLSSTLPTVSALPDLSTVPSAAATESQSLEGILNLHSEDILQGSHLCLQVSRKDLFSQAVSFYKTMSSKKLSRPLWVEFEGEGGVDAGGLTREFFTQLFKKITAPGRGLFEGPPRKLWPVHNVMAVRTRMFKFVGTAIAHSIVQCGMGFTCLSPALYRYLICESEEDAMTEMVMEDMPESETKAMLIELGNAHERDAFQLLLERCDIIEMISGSGWTGTISFNQREAILQCVLINEMFYKRRAAIDHFCDGLARLDVLELMKRNANVMRTLFVTKTTPLTLQELHDIMVIEELHSEKRERAEVFFQQLLFDNTDIDLGEGTVGFLPALLQFTTAVDTVEQLPQGTYITVGFHEEGDETATMPMSSTCTFSLTLPIVHTEYESFKRDFIKTLEFGIQGFGVE